MQTNRRAPERRHRSSWVPRTPVECGYCGRVFFPDPHEVKRGGGRFCKPGCAHAAHTGIGVRLFWERVDRRGPDDCWLWTRSIYPNGYGQVTVPGNSQYTHRLAWTLTNGDIPDGAMVLHRCDERYPVGDITYRRCCNPAHLFLGTHDDNMKDMVAKRRWRQSDAAAFTVESIRDIRNRYASGDFTQASLATLYGVSIDAIHDIVNRKTWREVI